MTGNHLDFNQVQTNVGNEDCALNCRASSVGLDSQKNEIQAALKLLGGFFRIRASRRVFASG